jgi:hypothetical protein
MEWVTLGCPTQTGNPWTKEEIWEAVQQGPHQSALSPEAITHFSKEAAEKVQTKQARIMAWDDIKDNPPRELNISLITAIPHKSMAFCSILDLSFRGLKLKNGGVLASVNNTMEKTAPKGAIDQIGECLLQIIHTFAEVDKAAKLFMAKWDIKNGFWCLDCVEGEEYNFAYVLPQLEGDPIRIVILTSLKMGLVESPPYFCTATETARDVAKKYTKLPINSLRDHKFVNYTIEDKGYEALPATATHNTSFLYMVKVYMDDFMILVIPISQDQLRCGNGHYDGNTQCVHPQMPTTVMIQSPRKN